MGHSPLHIAYWYGHDIIIKLLCSFGGDMYEVRNVSDKCNNIFTVYDDMDIVILYVMIYYKHDLIICGYMLQLLLLILTG